jgi:hypothetical protein
MEACEIVGNNFWHLLFDFLDMFSEGLVQVFLGSLQTFRAFDKNVGKID